MTEWQYYLTGENPSAEDDRGIGLIRMPAGGPVSLAETVLASGEWALSDVLWRNRYEGADETVTEVGADVADMFLTRWVRTGRIAAYPGDESGIAPAQAAALVDADRQARQRWARVQPPPGADEIRF